MLPLGSTILLKLFYKNVSSLPKKITLYVVLIKLKFYTLIKIRRLTDLGGRVLTMERPRLEGEAHHVDQRRNGHHRGAHRPHREQPA